jgi:putative copper export protein/methionine-rich copper-binding protein CopC
MIGHLSFRTAVALVSRAIRRRSEAGPANGRMTGRRRAIGPELDSAIQNRWSTVLLSVVITLSAASTLYAHLALLGSSPTGDERLLATPASVDLTFTEAVEVALSSVILLGPDGQPVSLGALATNDARDRISAPISGELRAGTHTVEWQAVGRDGHPVRGVFTFVIEEGASGLAVDTPVVTPAATTDEGSATDTGSQLPTFDTQSPLYAAVRWLSYVGILGTLGAVGFAFLLTSPRVRSEAVSAEFGNAATRGAAGLGIFAALALGASLPLRLQAQSHALFGAGITSERFSLLLGSDWGSAWLAQLLAAVVVLSGLLLARRGVSWGWYVAAVGAVVSAAMPGFSGHAAAVEGLRGLAIAADGLHILGVGVWLGTLVALLLVGAPLSRKIRPENSGEVLATLIHGFSPLALLAGGLVVATGALASLLHLTALADLWQTPYGRLLAVKLLLVAAVMAAGAFNWRVAGPAAARPGGQRRLLRTASAELAVATLVVAITAVLVALPAPAHSGTPVTAAGQTQAPAEPGAAATLDLIPQP